jgi:hypothetical protein
MSGPGKGDLLEGVSRWERESARHISLTEVTESQKKRAHGIELAIQRGVSFGETLSKRSRMSPLSAYLEPFGVKAVLLTAQVRSWPQARSPYEIPCEPIAAVFPIERENESGDYFRNSASVQGARRSLCVSRYSLICAGVILSDLFPHALRT